MSIDLTENKDSLFFSEQSIAYLHETTRWTKFLAILGFIACGILIIVGFFATTLLSTMSPMNQSGAIPFPGFVFGLIYVIIALFYLIPCYYLFQFSAKMKLALLKRDSMLLESALQNQKSLYKFMGILAIALIAIYAVLIICIVMIGIPPRGITA